MATTTGTRNYVDFDEYIDFQLQKTRSNIKSTDILTAIAGVAAMFLAYLLVFVVFDHWIVDGGFGPVARWLMLGGLLVACAGWVAWKVIIPYRKNVSQLYAARTIESTEPGLKNTLLNLVDLRNAGREIPESIRTAMEKRAAVTLSKADVDAVVDRRPLMRWSYVLLTLVVLCCLYSLFSPKKISASVWRALFPASQTAVDTAIKIDRVSTEIGDRLHDPDITVPIRSKVNIVVDLSYTGDAPESVTLFYSTEDRKFVDVPVPMNADPNEPKRYRVQLNGENGRGILQTTTYRVEAGDAKAGPFTVTVVRPPIATVLSVKYVYPKYMERESRTKDGGHIETWEGTTVTITAETDQPVREAKLVFTETENIKKPVGERAMTITNGTQLSVTLHKELAFNDDKYPRFYHLQCVGKNGFQDPEPALYGITIRKDLPPTIELVEPQGTERDIPANMESLPLLYRAKDPDFKVRFVTLHAELTRGATPDDKPRDFSESLFDGPARQSILGKFDWNLRPFQFKAGDSIRFRLQARDNKQPGENRAYSRWVTLRIVEPVTKNELQQQQQQDQQRRDQLQQQEQRNNAENQQPGEQPQDGNPQEQNNPDQQNQKKPGSGQKQPPNGDPENGMQDGGGKKTTSQGKPSNMGTGNPQQNPDGGADGNPMQSPDGMGQKQNGMGNNPENKSPPKKPQDAQDLLTQLDENQRKQDANQNQKDGTKQPQTGTGENNANQQPQPKDNGTGEQPKKGTNPDGSKPENGTSKTGNKTDGSKPDGMKKSGTDPDGMKNENPAGTKPEPKTGMNDKPSNKEQPGMGSGNDSGKTPGSEGMKKQQGTKPDAKSRKKNSGENTADPGTPGTEPKKQQPGMKNAGDSKKPGPQQKSKTPGGKQNGGGEKTGMKQGGNKPMTGTPQGTDNKTPNQKTDSPGENPSPKNGTGKEPKNKTDAGGGKKETVPDNGKPAKKQKATGDETGMADPNNDPNADPTKSKNPDGIKRREGTDPATKKRTGTGDPNDPGKKESRKTPGDGGKSQTGEPPTGMKTSGKEPPKTGADGNKQPGGKQATSGKTSPEDGGKKPLPKSGGGMNGGKPTGDPGTTQKPAQPVKTPGQGNKTGMPGQKPGGGANAKSTGNNDKSGMNTDTNPMPGGQPDKGGNSRGQQPGGGSGNPKKASPTDPRRGGTGDGTGPFQGNEEPPQLPPPASTSDKDLQEYGKKASNLQLNRLEDQLKRGKTDPRKLGFNNLKDALDFVQKTKSRVNNADKTGDTQMLEYLKTKAFRDYQRQVGKRTGDNMRKKALSGVGRASRSEAPPHLKDYANAFKNSVGSGR